MEELWSIWTKISGAGLAGMLFAIMYASRKRIWAWDYQLEEVRVQLQEMKADRDKWQGMALDGMQLSREGTQLGQQGARIAQKALADRP